jgi:hypothetical protein
MWVGTNLAIAGKLLASPNKNSSPAQLTLFGSCTAAAQVTGVDLVRSL